MWFLPDGDATCETAAGMQLYLQDNAQGNKKLLQRCCQKGGYWEKQPPASKRVSS